MATIVVMPALGNSVESCLITTWLVKEGDDVKENDTLCDVETDKAAMEVPCTASGTVLKLLWNDGDEVPVKEPLLIVGEPGEDISALLTQLGDSTEPSVDDAPPTSAVVSQEAQASVVRQASDGAVSPRARGLAAERHFDVGTLRGGSGPHGRVIERDVQASLAAGGGVTAAAARAGGVGTDVAGSGLGGRVTAADLGHLSSQSAAGGLREDEVTEVPLKGIRKVIAERMMYSLASTAQLTYNTTARADGLLAMRKRCKASDPELGYAAITIGDLVGFAAVRTAAKHPAHNAHLEDGVLRQFATVHLGFACDTPRGLLVPVVRDASRLTLREFSTASKQLARSAIDSSISPDDLQGATFTVSNLGGFGIESFTPILNVPQTAILGVDAIMPRAVALPDGSVGVEQRIGLSLTADHRVIDGADAARFLQDLVWFIENIELAVMG